VPDDQFTIEDLIKAIDAKITALKEASGGRFTQEEMDQAKVEAYGKGVQHGQERLVDLLRPSLERFTTDFDSLIDSD
jgi:hypothetical protein